MSVPINPWKQSDNFSTSRHQQLVDGINQGYPASAAGEVDILRVPGGAAVSVWKDGRIVTLVRVRVDTAASGDGGCYNGFLQRPPDIIKKAGTGNLSATDLGGTPPGTPDTFILNAHEKGKSTHDLTMTPVVVDTFLGQLIGVNSDGKYVVVINGIDIKDCGTSPAQLNLAPAEDPSVYHVSGGAMAQATASR